MNPVSNDRVLPFCLPGPVCKKQSPLIINGSSFPEKTFSGTQAALEITGTHGRPNGKVESAPAAIFPLSAACRCASRPPSNPSVLPPEIGTQPAMAGFSCVCFPLTVFSRFAPFFPPFAPLKQFVGTSQSATYFVTLTVTFSVFLTPFLPDLRNSESPSGARRKNYFAGNNSSFGLDRVKQIIKSLGD
jgi:hypothetical protein